MELKLSLNVLQQAHNDMVMLPKQFREIVCKECDWSEATYYRKIKGKNTFSNAEKEKIRCILKDMVTPILILSNNIG